jgi:hypothetical protein
MNEVMDDMEGRKEGKKRKQWTDERTGWIGYRETDEMKG